MNSLFFPDVPASCQEVALRKMKKAAVIIINPVAGGGRGRKLIHLLEPEFEKMFGEEYELQITQGTGHASQLARQAVEREASLILAVGGDGTLNEVVNGMLHNGPNSCELGILNCGSGSGMAQTLQLPTNLSAQLEMACNTTAKPLDVGVLHYDGQNGKPAKRLFISECQAGISAYVVSRVGMKHKRFGGSIAFASVAIPALFRYRALEMTIRLDQSPAESRKLIGISIGNGNHCAGGMQLTPLAFPDDGWLDVLRIGEMALWERLVNFPKVYRGSHIHSPHFKIGRAREIEIEAEEPVWVETDGELIGKTPCRISMLPGAIQVRRP